MSIGSKSLVHEPPALIQERLKLHGYDWRSMTIIGIDKALREIRDKGQTYEAYGTGEETSSAASRINLRR